MSIRPVDMQAVMPRSVETSRTNSHENTRPQTEHQQFAAQVQKNVRTEEQSIVHSNKSEGSNVNKDGRGNSGGSQNRRRKRPGADKDVSPRTGTSTMLDISL